MRQATQLYANVKGVWHRTPSLRPKSTSLVVQGTTVDPKYPSQGKKKRRLDEICLQLRPDVGRRVVQSWIAQGQVKVGGKVIDKAGAQVSSRADVQINGTIPKYVCRGGLKLEAALDHFHVVVQDRVALDSGLSTGGFADVLLQRGAGKVYGVDVGYGQVANKIRDHPKCVVIERTNLRNLTQLPEKVNLVTLDLSFISVLKVMPAINRLTTDDVDLVMLIKPQFEAEKGQVGSGGVIRDEGMRQDIVLKVIQGVENQGYSCQGYITSPIKGAKSENVEYLAHFRKNDWRQP